MPQPGWIPWATCAARPIMLQGLEPGGYLFENKSISFQEAYQHYSAMPEFANVVFSQFKARLTSYRKLAPDRGSWIKWNVKCGARQMILDDLQPGGVLYEQPNVTAEQAYTFYRTFQEFEHVVLSQFKARLESHREQANEKSRVSHEEMQALIHDRKLYPRQSHNARGEQVFDMSPAKPLLRQDVRDKKHTTMTPRELQKTRTEYMAFKPCIFKSRIYQAVRLEKYFTWLEKKRQEKREKAGMTSEEARSHNFSEGNG